MIYPLSREQTIEELSDYKTSRPVELDYKTLQAYAHYASENYDAAFKQDDRDAQQWWDGALAMVRWIIEAEGE